MKTITGFMKSFLINLLLIIIVFCNSKDVWSQTKTDKEFRPPSGQSIDQLKTKVENYLAKNDIPGAAVAVVTRDSVIFTGGFGYADTKNRIPVTENTHFMLGSITKSFLSLGIIKLVEEGKINLETPVKDILSEVIIKNPWEDTDPVRLVHLLEHTAGLCDGISTLFNWRHDPDIPLDEVVQLLHKRIVIHHRPGSFYLYSNNGYLLAGIILEKITKMRYEEYLKREILVPLGMETTTFNTNDPYSRSILAQGYGSGGKEIPYLHVYPRSAGHSHSSVLEMAQYVRFFLNSGKSNGSQIIKPESVKRLEIPITSLASRMGLAYGYGLGSECSYRNGFKWRGHNGAIFGYYCDFWYNQDLNIGYVVLINQFDFQSRGNVRRLRELIAEHLTKGTKPVFQPSVSIPKDQLDEYTGTYFIGYGAKDPLGLINFINGKTKVKRTGNTLSLNPFSGSKEDLIPVSNALFRKHDVPHATVAFFTNSDGTKAMVEGRDYFEKMATWESWLIIFYLLWTVLMMLSTIIYSFFWIPAYLYKKIFKKQQTTQYVSVKILPLMAILVLFIGIILIANQDIFYLGKRTLPNILFFISTWLFALLSLASLISAIGCLKRLVRKALRVYSMVVACTFVSMALFLWYWGIIGWKPWL